MKKDMYDKPEFNFEENDQMYAVYYSGKLLALSAFPPEYITVIPVENKHPNAKFVSLNDSNKIAGGKHIINIIKGKLNDIM